MFICNNIFLFISFYLLNKLFKSLRNACVHEIVNRLPESTSESALSLRFSLSHQHPTLCSVSLIQIFDGKMFLSIVISRLFIWQFIQGNYVIMFILTQVNMNMFFASMICCTYINITRNVTLTTQRYADEICRYAKPYAAVMVDSFILISGNT